MAAKKKPTKKKTTTKKTKTTKKCCTTKNCAKSAIKAKYSKSQIVATLADYTELSKKQITSVFDGLGCIIECHIKKNACGEFVLPGLLKVATVRKPATKARKGINPFTGEEAMFKAKPARTVVKVRPLKKLKEMVM